MFFGEVLLNFDEKMGYTYDFNLYKTLKGFFHGKNGPPSLLDFEVKSFIKKNPNHHIFIMSSSR
jgi:hypothetical protein